MCPPSPERVPRIGVLVVSDSYIGAEVFTRVFEPLVAPYDVRHCSVDESHSLNPSTESERALREYLGTPEQVAGSLRDEAVLVVHAAPVTDRVLDASPNLRLVGCARGGPVNVDVAAATERGIAVVCAPGRNADAVADQTIAFIIMLARRFSSAQRAVLGQRGGLIGNFDGKDYFGHELGGHTLGLVGYGNVGRRVASRALAFGMRVCAYDPFTEFSHDGRVRRCEQLEELLIEADFVSLHARASPENANLFDAEAFAAMKPGACFVNTARETLVDEVALEAALSSGHLAGAALDVVRSGEAGQLDRLLAHENVVVTPHIGGATHETLTRGVEMIRDEVDRFATRRPLLNLITPSAGANG